MTTEHRVLYGEAGAEPAAAEADVGEGAKSAGGEAPLSTGRGVAGERRAFLLFARR